MKLYIVSPNMYINTNTSNMYDGIECSASLIFGIIHNIVKEGGLECLKM